MGATPCALGAAHGVSAWRLVTGRRTRALSHGFDSEKHVFLNACRNISHAVGGRWHAFVEGSERIDEPSNFIYSGAVGEGAVMAPHGRGRCGNRRGRVRRSARLVQRDKRQAIRFRPPQSVSSGSGTSVSSSEGTLVAGKQSLTLLMVNAQHLTRSVDKALGLFQLLRTKNFPELAAVVELGCGANEDLRFFFENTGLLQRYSIVWSARCISREGGAVAATGLVGGGVLLLVRKSLRVTISEVPFSAVDDDRKWVPGHIGVWRLDPRVEQSTVPAISNRVSGQERGAPTLSRALMTSAGFSASHSNKVSTSGRASDVLRRSVIATVAYIPPASCAWGKTVRPHLIRALHSSEEAVLALRRVQDVFHLVFAHVNALDGGACVPLVLDSGTARHADLRNLLTEQTARGEQARRLIEFTSNDSIQLNRQSAASTKVSTAEGRELVSAFALRGMVPLSGVFSVLQPSTWQPCAQCLDAGRHCVHASKARLRNSHDSIYVPADSVVDSLFVPAGECAWLSTRRVDWARAINHAVTTARIGVAATRLSEFCAEDSVVCPTTERAKILKLPHNIKKRAAVRREAAVQYQRLSLQHPLSASADIDALAERFVSDVRSAHRLALESVLGPGSSPSAKSSEECTAIAAVSAAHAELVRARVPGTNDWRSSKQRVVWRAAETGLRRAQTALKEVRRAERAQNIVDADREAPIDMWEAIDADAADHGAPLQRKCALMQRINDADGRFITTNLNRTLHHLHAHRRGVYQLGQLSAECEQLVDESLEQMSQVNSVSMQEIGTLGAQSAAAISAGDALAPMEAIDARRGFLRARLSAAIKLTRVQPALQAMSLVRARFKDQCQLLERDLEMDELCSVVSELTEVGCGIDGVQVSIIKLFGQAELAGLFSLLSAVWRTGTVPKSWLEVRCMLVFKGKGSDAHCVDNYRGIGISVSACKILSLLMTKRLAAFVTATGALSRSQTGFLSLQGTPEAAMTLAEACRAAARGTKVGSPTYLLFIDIRRAYDSVVHAILWKRCADKGIGGRFLTTLQAMYQGASAVLDIDGLLLEPVPIEASVLQGNSLSSLLFDIYIDPVLRELDRVSDERVQQGLKPFGIPLPRVDPNTGRMLVQPCNASPAADRMISQFFADDGGLPATAPLILQAMADVSADALRRIGFDMNVGKTKAMITAPLEATAEEYAVLKQEAQQCALKVANEAVSWVDKFEYLGMMFWWRLNFDLAWAEARQRVYGRLHQVRLGEFQKHGTPPALVYKYAAGKVLTPFGVPAVVSGAYGTKKSQAWSMGEAAVTDVLRTVSCLPRGPDKILRLEFGVWAMRLQIFMRLARFWAKTCHSDPDSFHYRAMYLSWNTTTNSQRSDPFTADSRRGRVHRQTWAQQVRSALRYLELGELASVQNGAAMRVTDVAFGLTGLLAAVVTDSASGVTRVWHEAVVAGRRHLVCDGVVLTEAAAQDLQARARAAQSYIQLVDIRVPIPAPAAAVEGTNCWHVAGQSDPAVALRTWTTATRDASYAVIWRLANAARQREADAQLAEMAQRGGAFAAYSAIKSGNTQEAYLSLPSRLAVPMLRLRGNFQSNEEAARRAPITRQVFNRRVITTPHAPLPRVEPREARCCYFCNHLGGQLDLFPVESIDHMLLNCRAYDSLRAQFRADATECVRAVTAAATSHLPPAPDLRDSTTLATLCRLATSIGHQPLLVPAPPTLVTGTAAAVPTSAARQAALARRAGPAYSHDQTTARNTAAWLSAVSTRWRRLLHTHGQQAGKRAHPLDSDGAEHLYRRLFECVTTFVVRVFATRRSLLRERTDFHSRDRDPRPAVVAGTTAAATTVT